MDRGADFDSALGGQAAGDAQHFGAVGLHGEIAQGSRVGTLTDADRPAEDGVDHAQQHGLIDGSIRPGPELPVCFLVSLQEVSSDQGGCAIRNASDCASMPY